MNRIPNIRYRVWTALSLALLALMLLAAPLMAEQPVALSHRPAAQDSGAPTEPIDVVVVLDDSGSMATCWPWPREGLPFEPPCRAPSGNPPSDPDELRYSAARLLIQLADADDRIAVVRFDTAAEGVGAMGSLQRIGDDGARKLLTDSLQPPTDYYRRGYTRIDLGLESALSLLQSVREPGRNQYVLLLTDGEPTQPDGAGPQRPRIAEQLQTLRDEGVFVFPVVLCNPTAGCAGEFLRERFADYGVTEANNAQELLRVFSEILTQMKPDRSVITTRNSAGALQVNTRAAHGIRKVAVVTPRGGLQDVRRGEEPILARTALDDPNIDVNIVDAAVLAEGLWTMQTGDSSGFAVVQADSYPELLNPPPSIANSPASVRYYPAGKSPLLIARSVGPGAGETLLYNGKTPLESFGRDNTYAFLPTDQPGLVRLQLGDDTEPLQLMRSFRLEPRFDLPQIEVFSPRADASPLREDGYARLQASFGNAEVEGLGAAVYVFELDSAGNRGGLAHQAPMRCADRLCSDESFKPADGRAYEIFFIVQGQVDGLRFSDWTQATLALDPAIYLRGLPPQIDLANMPQEGWNVELSSGTQEEIGELSAVLTLRRSDTGEEVGGVSLDFAEDVPEEGALQSLLHVTGLDTLRPGDYTGEITLAAKGPTGLPMEVAIRPGPTLPVSFSVARPLARIETQSVDFGELLFDTSPNFRLNEQAQIDVSFAGKPFDLSVSLQESSCDGITVTPGDVEMTAEGGKLPLRLTSRGPVAPNTCSGTIFLVGPDGDHDVTPQLVEWRIRVAGVEWSIVNGDLHLSDLQDAGARLQETLLIRFNGKTPFVLQAAGISGIGSVAGSTDDAAAPTMLTADYLDIPPVEVSGPPNESGLYEVPLTLIARQGIPGDQLRGSFYSGQIELAIAGLDAPPKAVNFNFRSPSIYQRYFSPVVTPVYSMPWVLCTGPLTLLLLLVMVARVRNRGFDESAVEEAAMAAAIQSTTVPAAATAAAQAQFMSAAGEGARIDHAPGEVVWGNSEFGSVWSTPRSSGETTSASYAAGGAGGSNGASGSGGDPWTSSW